MSYSILIVCTGNICRSPMAEGLLREALAGRDVHDVEVSSAGTIAPDGMPPAAEGVEAMEELGIDISDHLTRRLDRELIAAAGLVIAMTREQRDLASQAAPEAAGRIFTLKELVRLLAAAGGSFGSKPESPAEALRAGVARAGRVRAAGESEETADEDVADPLGLSVVAFRATAWELGELIDRLLGGLLGDSVTAAAGGGPDGEGSWE